MRTADIWIYELYSLLDIFYESIICGIVFHDFQLFINRGKNMENKIYKNNLSLKH